MNRTYTVVFGALMFALSFPLGASAQGRKADPDFVRARQLFFGAENVDPRSGSVKHDKVIFSWFTNSSYAVSLKGRVVLLDSYIHRAETVPGLSAEQQRRNSCLGGLSPEYKSTSSNRPVGWWNNECKEA